MKRLLLSLYTAFLLGIAVWRPWAEPAAPFSRQWQLVPFTGTAALWRSGIVPFTFFFVGNIACFVPFGFGLPALTRLRRAVIPLCFLGSLLIESFQWAFGTGIPQIEDLLLNTLGGALGYALFRAIRHERNAEAVHFHPRWNRLIHRVVTDCFIVYAIVSCVACAVANRAMFHPPHPVYGEDIAGLVTMGPPDAPVAGVWMPVEGATSAVLFAHGNAEDLRHVHARLARFNRLSISALAYDYPGYGRTPGCPTESSVYAAAETAFRHLVEERGFAESNIVVCGFSIGSGPACYLAEKHDVGGLLLYAPFKSAIRVVTRIRLLPIDPFPNLARIPRTRCPVLVLHGSADKVIAPSHGQAIAAAAGERGRYIEVPGANHDIIGLALRFPTFQQAFEECFATQSGSENRPSF